MKLFGVSIELARSAKKRTETHDATRHAARHLRQAYDAEKRTNKQREQWKQQDALGALTANRLKTRKEIRERARVAYGNFPYACGIVDGFASDIVGTTPRVNVTGNAALSKAFALYAARIGLDETLRTAMRGWIVDGESFFIFRNAPDVFRDCGCGCFVSLVECDRITDADDKNGDGIAFDALGRAVRYRVKNRHPSEKSEDDGHVDVDAAQVLHLFTRKRAEQVRGVSALASVLDRLVSLRDFKGAALQGAHVAANFSAVVKDNSPPQIYEVDADGVPLLDESGAPILRAAPKVWDDAHLPAGGLVMLPQGCEIQQLKAEQPVASLPDFEIACLREIARAMGMPLTVFLGDASDASYAAARLEGQWYFRALRVLRHEIARRILSPIFREFCREFLQKPKMLFSEIPAHSWTFDGADVLDPMKEANAARVRLETGTTTLEEECAQSGKDYRDVLRQRAIERDEARALGFPNAYGTAPLAPDDGDDDDGDEKTTGEK